ncbi:MAG: aromatic ring-hydroxylating dioxygenase subunit alpha [Pseudomonadota bacterium]
MRQPVICATDIDATDRELGAARTLPGYVYSDPAVFAADCDRLFAGGWFCAGHGGQLDGAGDFVKIDVAADSYLLCRQDDGSLQAFFNVCRHRGTRITGSERGSCRRFVCPYHGWAYALDGGLCDSPLLPGGLQRDAHGLAPVGIAQWNGFVFLNPAGGAGPLERSLEDLPDLSRFRLPDQQPVATKRYEVAANWKLIVENFNECYHCALAHPELHRMSRGRVEVAEPQRGRAFTGGPMPLVEPNLSVSVSGRLAGPERDGVTDADRGLIYYYHLYPNLLLTIAPDYVMTHLVWPSSTAASVVATTWYATAAQRASPQFGLAGVTEFWDRTNRQDWTLCETAQLGVSSRGHIPGPYHSDEQCVHDFDRWYVREMNT